MFSGSQFVAALLSGVAAFLFVLGLALQQKGHVASLTRARSRESTSAWDAVRSTVSQPVWLVGIVTGGLLGFVVLTISLHLGSLTIVEPVQVTQMLFTVPLSAWVAGTTVRRAEWRAAAVLMVGLAVLMVTMAPEAGNDHGEPGRWQVVVPAVFAGAALCAVVARSIPSLAAALFGAGCGLCFGLQASVLKEFTTVLAGGLEPGRVLGHWSVWLVLASSAGGVLLQTFALRAGRLSAAQTTITTIGPLLSSLLGVVVFGETVSTEPGRIALAVVAAAALLWGVSSLAHSPALVAAAGEGVGTDR